MLRRSDFVWLALYLAAMGAVWVGLVSFRAWALKTYGAPQAQQNWEAWRLEADRQAGGEGPVARRRLRSETPPALVLMTDHFLSIAAVTFVLSTALFGALMFMIRGVLQTPAPVIHDEKPARRTSG